MALEGTFRDFGLAEIFQLVGLQKKTGVLTVKGGDESHVVTVSFDKGMVTFADAYRRGEKERLGSILLRSHLISKEDLERAVQTQKETLQRLGHVLVQMKFISQEDLRGALQSQVKETVYRLFRWKEGSYHFSPEPVTYDKEMYQPIAAEFLLMEGVRMIDEWPIIEKKIASFDMVFEKVPGKEMTSPEGKGPAEGTEEWDDLVGMVDEEEKPGAKPARPSAKGESTLSPREKGIYDLVDGVRTVQEIVDIGKIGEFKTCKVLYSFLSIGLIQPVERAVAGRPSRAPSLRRRSLPVTDIMVVLGAVALLVAVLLFNPWSIFVLNFNARQSRQEIASLRDDMKMQRLRHGLEIFFLEKQVYPYTLEKLPEDGLLSKGDIRNHLGHPFAYRAGEKEYQLEKE